jgi:hypothetical protein
VVAGSHALLSGGGATALRPARRLGDGNGRCQEDPDPPRRAGSLWPVISGLLRNDPGSAWKLLPSSRCCTGSSRQATRAAPPRSCCRPADLSRGEDSATEPPRERLRRPERTHAFEPLVTARVMRLPETGPSPPEGSATPAAAVPARPVPDPGSPAGCGSALTQPLRGEDSQMTELLAGLMPAREAASSSVPGHLHLRTFPRRRTWLITAVAAALVVAAGVLIRPSVAGHHAARASQPATSPASAPTGTGQAERVPRGYHAYADPTGFSIAVPSTGRCPASEVTFTSGTRQEQDSLSSARPTIPSPASSPTGGGRKLAGSGPIRATTGSSRQQSATRQRKGRPTGNSPMSARAAAFTSSTMTFWQIPSTPMLSTGPHRPASGSRAAAFSGSLPAPSTRHPHKRIAA